MVLTALWARADHCFSVRRVRPKRTVSTLVSKNQLLRYALIEQCRQWMLPEEIRALTRIGLTEHGEKVTREIAARVAKMEFFYGFNDDKTNQLVSLGSEALELTIANNLLKRHDKQMLNYCPTCNGLTRTPKSKQSRHCGHDWH